MSNARSQLCDLVSGIRGDILKEISADFDTKPTKKVPINKRYCLSNESACICKGKSPIKRLVTEANVDQVLAACLFSQSNKINRTSYPTNEQAIIDSAQNFVK